MNAKEMFNSLQVNSLSLSKLNATQKAPFEMMKEVVQSPGMTYEDLIDISPEYKTELENLVKIYGSANVAKISPKPAPKKRTSVATAKAASATKKRVATSRKTKATAKATLAKKPATKSGQASGKKSTTPPIPPKKFKVGQLVKLNEKGLKTNPSFKNKECKVTQHKGYRLIAKDWLIEVQDVVSKVKIDVSEADVTSLANKTKSAATTKKVAAPKKAAAPNPVKPKAVKLTAAQRQVLKDKKTLAEWQAKKEEMKKLLRSSSAMFAKVQDMVESHMKTNGLAGNSLKQEIEKEKRTVMLLRKFARNEKGRMKRISKAAGYPVQLSGTNQITELNAMLVDSGPGDIFEIFEGQEQYERIGVAQAYDIAVSKSPKAVYGWDQMTGKAYEVNPSELIRMKKNRWDNRTYDFFFIERPKKKSTGFFASIFG